MTEDMLLSCHESAAISFLDCSNKKAFHVLMTEID